MYGGGGSAKPAELRGYAGPNGGADGEELTEFIMSRDPQDYPVNTSSVFMYYIGTANHTTSDPILPNNWAFGQELEMQFPGALPPRRDRSYGRKRETS